MDSTSVTADDGVQLHVSMCGSGPDVVVLDREWSAAYEAGKAKETPIEIDWVPEVHAGLWGSFKDWVHEPRLWRDLADSGVPMSFIAAGADIRPCWPLEQLAELVPRGTFEVVPGVPHDFWATDPDLWRRVCTAACDRVR